MQNSKAITTETLERLLLGFNEFPLYAAKEGSRIYLGRERPTRVKGKPGVAPVVVEIGSSERSELERVLGELQS